MTDSAVSRRAVSALGQELVLRTGMGHRQRAGVRGPGFIVAPEAPQQVGAGRVQVAVAVEPRPVEQIEGRCRPVDIGHRHHPVELDDR